MPKLRSIPKLSFLLFICFISVVSAKVTLTTEQEAFIETLDLTVLEQAWLEKSDKVMVHPDTWPPFNYWDVKTGTTQGICVEYLRWIEQKTGINFVFPAMWMPLREVLPALRNKTLDLSPSLQKTAAREKYLNYSTVLYQESFYLFGLTATDKKAETLLQKRITVSCEDGSTTYNHLKLRFPNIKLLPAATEEDGLRMVANKRCDFHAGAGSVCKYLIKNYYGLEHIKTTAPLNYSGQGIYMTARKDWPELVTIIDKALTKMPPELKHKIVDSYINTIDWNRYKDQLFWVLSALVIICAMTIYLLLRSIQKQRLQKDLLVKNDLKLTRATETAKLYFLEYFPKKRVFRLNANAATSLMGNTNNTEISIKDCLRFIYYEDHEVVKSALRQPNYGTNFRIRITRPSGQFIFLNCFVNYNALASSSNVLVSCLDITREVLYNKQLLCTQRIAHIGYFRFDQKKRRFLLTEETCRILDLPITHNSYSLKHLLTLVSIKVRNTQINRVKQIIEQRHYEYKTTLKVKAHGQQKYILMISRFIYNEKGEVVLQEGYIQDITEIKKTELQLKQAKNQAEMANKAKSTFLARMSHEIRTPLNVIVGMLNLTLKTPLNAKQKNYIIKSCSSSQLLLSLINDILDFSKIEADKVTLQHASFNLKGCFEQVKKLLIIKAAEKKLNLRIMIDGNVAPFLYADELRLKQVLINLINNAIKFTNEGEVVVKLMLAKEPSMLQITISDNGIGIAQSKQHQLFESFIQLDNSLITHQEGTGLGLSICKHIVELWGGKIWVHSTLGIGSTFGFTIPAIEGTPPIEANKTTAYLPTMKRSPKLLLAEDNLLNQEIAYEVLTGFNVDTTIVNNGLEAINAITNNNFDIVLMDLNMPKKDGISATMEIRKQISKEQLPIIAVTAYALPELKLECIKAGMNDYISKPFTESELSAMLHKWLPNIYNQNTATNHLSTKLVNESKALSYFNNDKSKYRKYLQMFFETLTPRFADLKNIETNQYQELGKLAHTLKSEAGYLGLDPLEALCKNIQHEINLSNFDQMKASLCVEITNTSEKIKYILNDKSSYTENNS